MHRIGHVRDEMEDYDKDYYEDLNRDYSDQDSMMRHAEMVPLHVLKRMQEWQRRPGEPHAFKSPERYNALKQHIMEHGITSPVWIDYHPELGVGHISEGNHRLAIAEDLGMTHLPAVVYRSRRRSNGAVMPLTDTGDGGQYRRPSDFPELESTGNQPPNFRTAGYADFEPERGRFRAPSTPEPQWDEEHEAYLPREGGYLGTPPQLPFSGDEQNYYHWGYGTHEDHHDENLLPEHWKDNFVGEDARSYWRNPMDALRAHAQHLADQHGVETTIHPEWTDDRGPSDNANPADNTIHIRPVTNRMRYLVALHEIAHNVGGTEADWERGVAAYGVPPHNQRRVPLDYDREYKPKGYEFDGQKGMYPGADEPGFKYPQEWEIAKPEWLPDVEEHVPTSPYNHDENKLETEARAWDWAIQHSAVKVTPQMLRQMYRYLTSYADPREIGQYSPTFKRLWNEGEHPEEGWHEPIMDNLYRRDRYYDDWAQAHGEYHDDDSDAYDIGDEWDGFQQDKQNPLVWHHPETGEIREFESADGMKNLLGEHFPDMRVAGFIPYVPAKATQTPPAGLPGVTGGMPLKWGNAASEELTEAHVASGADHSGAMVALMLKPDHAKKLEVKDGEPADDMHITLAYFKDKAADRDDWDDLKPILENVAREFGPLSGEISGTGTFQGDQDVFIGTVDVTELAELHIEVKQACQDAGFPVSEDHGFNPHVTLKYVEPEDGKYPKVDIPVELSFDELTLMVGGARTDFDLQGDIVKTSDWNEDDHPRSEATGKFTVKQDIHEVKVYNKQTGKFMYTAKRCDKCGVIYGERPNKPVTSCPTCGEHPKRHSSATVHDLDAHRQRRRSLDQGAVADALGWQFWKTNQQGHKMYRWSGANPEGHVIQHTVTGYGDHGDVDWDAQKVRRNMKSCMNGTCDHIVAPNGVEIQATPQVKAPFIRAGAEVMYGGKQWWVMEVDGGLAHIYDSTGNEDIVPATQLQATGASQDRIERNKKFVLQLEDKWEDLGNTRDPDFVFVWFGGKLKVEAWEPNLRVRNMADQLVKEHGFLALEDYESFAENDSTSKWVTGEVWQTEAGNLKIEVTQLADPDVIVTAREAVEHFFSKADEAPDYTRLVHPQWVEVKAL